ncbi:MAG TPA: O-antigen ligase family protein [Candidatus Saccharimonadales bacterium]|nr:O-antigen ligase family protein [Candidatus Saccharimonadales bacterium]
MERIFRWPQALAILLLVYMPFHVFLSQWLSTYTEYLDVWKIWKDLLLALAVLLVLILVYIKRGFKDRLFWVFTGVSAVYFAIHIILWQAHPENAYETTLLATAYNCRLFGYAILGWGAGVLIKKHLDIKKIFKLAIIVSSIVCILGVLQLVLPQDFLSHFGYGDARGAKSFFFIDNKPELRRVMSTIREPNSLGAYLILPITVLVGAWLKKPRIRMLLSGLLLLHGLALFLTFSRSAWVGTFLSVALMIFWLYKDRVLNFIKKYWAFLLAGLVVIALGAFLLRDQYFVQNVLFHSDENTVLEKDSNERHVDLLVESSKSVAQMPFGHGPGTAGPVSVHTADKVIPENYFVQIAYEIGVFGLALLIAIVAFVATQLYRINDFYSKALLAAFVGITFCNLLLHTWANEAVAAQWWLLAGFAISAGLTGQKRT